MHCTCYLITLVVLLAAVVRAASWTSTVTGGSISATVNEPNPTVSTPALIIYLKNLSCERIGQESDASIIASFTETGYRVTVLDYANNSNATTPHINADVLKIRQDIDSGTFPGSTGLDATGLNANKDQCYILHEGYRLLRNVPYYKNDPTVYSGTDSGVELHMDIAYPSQPSRPIPIVLEYSCSNSYAGNADDRMNNVNAFTGINDTILEGAPAAGIAWAMADHPKYQQWGSPKLYSGFEVNPDTIKKVHSSIRVLREVGATLGLSGNINIHGFSRGATAGSLAIGDLTVPSVDLAGYSLSLSSRVQGVLLGSGIFDYSHSGGTTTGDPSGTEVDLYGRFVTAWGATAANLTQWQQQGALYYMATVASAPTFLSYNTDDAAFYVYQAQLLAAQLASLGVHHSVVTGSGAHHVTTNTTTQAAIYAFFNAHARAIPGTPGDAVLANYNTTAKTLDLRIDAGENGAGVLFAVYTGTNSTTRKWVQACGTVGTKPVWRTLAAWGSQVRVGPLTDLGTVRFTVVAYNPVRFTTVQNGVNIIANDTA